MLSLAMDISLSRYSIIPFCFPVPDKIDWILPGSIATGILLLRSETSSTLEVE